MHIKTWIKSRETPRTLADVARRILERDRKYRDVEKTLEGLYVLEALIKHGGDQQKAAADIGVCTNTVRRTMRAMDLTVIEVRGIARLLRRSKDASSTE